MLYTLCDYHDSVSLASTIEIEITPKSIQNVTRGFLLIFYSQCASHCQMEVYGTIRPNMYYCSERRAAALVKSDISY